VQLEIDRPIGRPDAADVIPQDCDAAAVSLLAQTLEDLFSAIRVTVTDSAPKQPKAKQAKKDTSPPRSNWPSAAAPAEITFEHCLRGLFQQIEAASRWSK
jgi:hypothetical protein